MNPSKAAIRKSARHSMRRPVRIGYVPLVDAAPLLIAEHLGLFEKQGVDVELQREAGWATVREKILYHQLDAAHAPAGLALSLRLGANGHQCRSLAPFVFNSNGNAITLSRDLYERGVCDAATLLKLIRSSQQHLYTFGVVAFWSSHHILLRDWMLAGGIDPDHDVRIIMLPPPQMPGALAAGLLDGYCAGEPWNSASIHSGTGWSPATSETIAPGHPEKVLLTTEEFAGQHSAELAGILRALHQACRHCDEPRNRRGLIEVLAPAFRLDGIELLLQQSLKGPFDTGLGSISAARFHRFHRDGINRPSAEQAEWLLQGFSRHRILSADRVEQGREALSACWDHAHYDSAIMGPNLSRRSARRRTPEDKKQTHPTRTSHALS